MGKQLHDRVIDKIVSHIQTNASFTKVASNPGTDKNKKVDDSYPDIVIMDLFGDVTRIGEVETPTNYKNKKQWEKYYNLDYKFYIWVEESRRAVTNNILQKRNIEADILTYSLGSDQRVIEVEQITGLL